MEMITDRNRTRPIARGHARVRPLEVAGFAALGIAAAVTDAEAYIDPGTGSYIFQLATAAVLAALFTLKVYWRRLKEKVRGRRNVSRPSPSSSGGDAKLE